jgi:biopolymer transport protein ExbB/TolQ
MILLRKIWSFIKVYWYMPVALIFLLVAYFIFRKDIDIFELLREREQLFKKEVRAIEKNNKLKDKLIEENQEEYFETINKIEKKIELKKREEKEKREVKLKEIEKHNNIDEIMEKIKDKYDWR